MKTRKTGAIMELARGRNAGGRPPACEIKERRLHLITVATTLFLSDGYEATSLENIAKVAGASKTTIYRNFGDKAELFRTIVDHFIEPIWPKLTDTPVQGKSLREVLTTYGTLVTSPAVFNSKSIALLRLIYRESPRFPELARIFTEAEQRTTTVVAEYLATCVRQGLLSMDDPTWAASQFLELVWGSLAHRLIIGLISLPDEAERRRVVSAAVTLFLDGSVVHDGETCLPAPLDKISSKK